MKAFTVVAALSFALLTVPAIAQQKPPVKPPATPPTQAAPQKPATPPAAQQLPPAPFPEGAKIAFCSPQEVANNSKDGKAAFAQIAALRDKRLKEIQDKQKQVDTDTTLMNSPTLADDKRPPLQKEIDRLNVEIQRAQQDATQELQELQNDLQQQFGRKLFPVAQQLAKEKGLQMILVADSQIIYWADPGLDLTAELTRRLDAAPAAAPKPPVPDSPVPKPAPRK